ncbi:MAG: SRPBCC family protein [Polyangiaceae bacterium]
MSNTEETPDSIRKQITLRAPLSRVWRAVSDAKQFGAWFGVDFDGPFVAGQTVTGRIVPTEADPEVAKLQEPYRGTPYEWSVERIDPEHTISFRWHPFAIEKGRDYSTEPTTLIVFELAPAAEGTLLTITESGFKQIPLERRAKAFAANEGGWEHQCRLVQKYLELHVG